MKRKRIEPGIYRVGKKYEADVHLTNPRTLKRERIRKRFTALSDARRFRKQKQREFSKGEPSKSKRTFRIRMKDAVALSLQAKLQTARRRSGEIDAEPATFGEMQRHLGIVEEFFGSDFLVNRIDEEHCQRFLDHLRGLRKQRPCRGPLSNQSIDHVLKELRYLLRLVKRKGYLERVPEIPFLGRHGKRVLKVSLEDFRKMVDELPPRWWPHRALMMMALNTGQRLGDLLAMTWDQVDFERGIVTYRSSKTDVEDIRAPLLSSTIEELEALLHFQSGTREGFIFLNPRTGKPMVCIKRALVNACKRSGVPRFTMHHVRHLATTVLLEATNGDRDLVRRIIGWSSMAMVDRYGHVGNRAFSAFANVERMLKSRFSDGC